MKKTKRELEIGDHVKETSFARTGRRRIGEIISILSDSKSDPTIECIRICPKELIPLEGGNGEIKRFKSKRSKLKHYIPRKNLFTKETFEVGKCVACKSGGRTRYGRIMGYLNQEEGLYPHSYDKGEYNGHDLLECVQIDPKPGLHRIIDEEGNPKKFVGYPEKCKLIKVLDTDDKGNPTTKLRLDIPKQID
jgi:ferredoxin